MWMSGRSPLTHCATDEPDRWTCPDNKAPESRGCPNPAAPGLFIARHTPGSGIVDTPHLEDERYLLCPMTPTEVRVKHPCHPPRRIGPTVTKLKIGCRAPDELSDMTMDVGDPSRGGIALL